MASIASLIVEIGADVEVLRRESEDVSRIVSVSRGGRRPQKPSRVKHPAELKPAKRRKL